MSDTTMQPQGEPRCAFCHCTYEGMERVGGEIPGWAPGKGYLCLGPGCVSRRSVAAKIASRQTERTRRDAVRPIATKWREKRDAKRAARKAKRSKIADGRNNRGLV